MQEIVCQHHFEILKFKNRGASRNKYNLTHCTSKDFTKAAVCNMISAFMHLGQLAERQRIGF